VTYLDALVAGGERSRWAYEAFGEVARDRMFMGVDNPGCIWAEVDTPADLIEASQRIPSHFVDFRAPRITTPELPDERRMWDIHQQPIPYMDRLLNSNFAREIQALAGAEDRIRDVLLRNRDRFSNGLRKLRVRTLSAADVHRAVAACVNRVEAQLARRYDAQALVGRDSLRDVLADVFRLCPHDDEALVITRETAAKLLEQLPPLNLMDAVGHRTIASLVEREDPLDVVAMCRTTEDEAWQARYKRLLADLTAEDFELRPIRHFVSDAAEYRKAFVSSKQAPKLWRISHNKETGTITCLTLDDLERFRAPLLLYVLVFIHYFFETSYASRFYRQVARTDPERLGEHVVASIYSHTSKLTFFYSNVYSENLFWDRALRVFSESFGSEDVELLAGLVDCGEYVPSSGAQDLVVSLNIIDHVWNLNFLGHGVGVDAFEHDTIYFLYHFRGALWEAIVNELTGATPAEMEALIVSNLATGDTALTRQLLAARRPLMV
jgi:hypothetical protein